MQAFSVHPAGYRRAGRRGFTLIELLVVVAIIAVLMAILLPALANARDQAKALKCSSNARSLSMMVMQYAAENNDYWIPNGEDKTTLPTPWYWKTIAGTYLDQSSPLVVMYGYENLTKLRNCPSNKGVLSPAKYLTGVIDSKPWALTKLSQVRNPAAVVGFSETPTSTEAQAYKPGYYQSNQSVYGSELLALPEPRHRTTNTFSFLDGHAEQVRGFPPTKGQPSEGYWRKTYAYP